MSLLFNFEEIGIHEQVANADCECPVPYRLLRQKNEKNSGGPVYVSNIRKNQEYCTVRRIPAHPRMQGVVFRPLYTCRSHENLTHSQQTLLSSGKCQPDRGMGPLFLPGIRKIHEDGSEEKTVQQVKHPGDAIRQILKEYKSPVLENMPTFTGGLVGYFSYDYIKYSEPKLELTDKTVQDFRDMDLMLFDQVIAFDHYRQKVLLITGVMTDDLENSYRKAEEKLKEMADLIRNGKQKEFPSLKLKSSIEPQFPKEKYCEMVETAKHYIHEGDIFQVVLSNPMRAKAEGSLFDTYRVLRATNPSPYMFYFSSDDIEIAGASPETLAKLTGTELSTFPLAGTRPRGKTKEEDLELERGLLADEKERAEHNMLVDLGRNDIGKISKIVTVKVEKSVPQLPARSGMTRMQWMQ